MPTTGLARASSDSPIDRANDRRIGRDLDAAATLDRILEVRLRNRKATLVTANAGPGRLKLLTSFSSVTGSPPVTKTIGTAVVAALADPAVRARLTDLGLLIVPREEQTPEAMRTFQKAEIEKWWPIIKEAGIKPE